MFNTKKITRTNSQLFFDNVMKAVAIIGVFMAIYYAYLELPSFVTLDSMTPKTAKILLGLNVFICYRIWLKKQSTFVRIALNVLIWGGLFLGICYYFDKMSTLDMIDFILKLAN
jgi:hypothetical protein